MGTHSIQDRPTPCNYQRSSAFAHLYVLPTPSRGRNSQKGLQAMESNLMDTFNTSTCQATKNTNLDGTRDIQTIIFRVMNRARITDSAPGYVGETLTMATVNITGNITMAPANIRNLPMPLPHQYRPMLIKKTQLSPNCGQLSTPKDNKSL